MLQVQGHTARLHTGSLRIACKRLHRDHCRHTENPILPRPPQQKLGLLLTVGSRFHHRKQHWHHMSWLGWGTCYRTAVHEKLGSKQFERRHNVLIFQIALRVNKDIRTGVFQFDAHLKQLFKLVIMSGHVTVMGFIRSLNSGVNGTFKPFKLLFQITLPPDTAQSGHQQLYTCSAIDLQFGSIKAHHTLEGASLAQHRRPGRQMRKMLNWPKASQKLQLLRILIDICFTRSKIGDHRPRQMRERSIGRSRTRRRIVCVSWHPGSKQLPLKDTNQKELHYESTTLFVVLDVERLQVAPLPVQTRLPW